MLDGYWQNRPSEPVKERILANWINALEVFTVDEVNMACQRWVRENEDKKPNHGHIYGMAMNARAGATRPLRTRMWEICKDVTERCGMPTWIITGSNRTGRVCDARAEAIYRSRQEGIPLAVIGEFFGGRDHTTIMAAIRRHEKNKEMGQ